MRISGVLFASLFFASAAMAAETAPFQVQEVMAQQKQIRADVLAGTGRYAKMPENKRDDLLTKQEHLMHLLEGKQTSSELTQDQYMEAFAALEWIEAAVNNQDDERVVCRREKTLGSNRTSRVCRTTAQLEQERDRAREQLDQRDSQMRR